tara:strand:+ start:4860 stop:5366 length:507 start_codon:yes stop_codon:yes gene_type:complete
MISQLRRRVLGVSTLLLTGWLLSGCAGTPQAVPAAANTTRSHAATHLSIGDQAASVAAQQVGVPYRYGGKSPSGFDCSGLVHYSYLQAGKALPRTTGQLWKHAKDVNRDDMRAGDLIFFSIEGKMQHVGLYLGDGKFVHAPQSGRTVSIASLSNSFYEQAFLRAGRPH